MTVLLEDSPGSILNKDSNGKRVAYDFSKVGEASPAAQGGVHTSSSHQTSGRR